MSKRVCRALEIYRPPLVRRLVYLPLTDISTTIIPAASLLPLDSYCAGEKQVLNWYNGPLCRQLLLPVLNGRSHLNSVSDAGGFQVINKLIISKISGHVLWDLLTRYKENISPTCRVKNWRYSFLICSDIGKLVPTNTYKQSIITSYDWNVGCMFREWQLWWLRVNEREWVRNASEISCIWGWAWNEKQVIIFSNLKKRSRIATQNFNRTSLSRLEPEIY